jgi:hypothetical protein
MHMTGYFREFPPGLYRHYKGGLYEVICLARHSETEDVVIVYREFLGRQAWVRPASMFTGKIKVGEKWLARFQRIASVEELEGGVTHRDLDPDARVQPKRRREESRPRPRKLVAAE